MPRLWPRSSSLDASSIFLDSAEAKTMLGLMAVGAVGGDTFVYVSLSGLQSESA